MTATLVTGGAGFIGSALGRALLEAGREVRVLDNLRTGSRARIPAGAELIEGDVRSPEDAERAVKGCEVVFHQAAVPSVSESIADPMLTEAINVQGTLQVLLAAERAGVRRVVNASSCAVYGDAGSGPAREGQALDPLSPYAVSKIAAEAYARHFSLHRGLEVVTLRYFNVFGPGQDPTSGYAAVFPAFISALTDGRAPRVHGDGEQTRDFVAIDDVVRANLLAASAGPDAAGRAINVGGGAPRSVNEVLRAVARACDLWIEPEMTPPRTGDIRHSSADISLARDLLGFEPTARFEDVVAATVAWFRSN